MRVRHADTVTIPDNPGFAVSAGEYNADLLLTGVPWFDPEDYGTVDTTGVVDSSAAIRAAATAAETAGGGIVWLPRGTLLVSGNPALHLLTGVTYVGRGMERPLGALFTTPSPVYGTRIKYLGGDACFASPNTATRRYAPGVENLTVYTIGATNGHFAIDVHNVEGGNFRNLLLNGYWSTNGTGIRIVGDPPSSATSANRFYNVVVAANVACVDLGDLANFNRFESCHFFGSGIAILAQPGSGSYNDTNVFIDCYISTPTTTIVQLGGGAGACRSFQFFGLRVERASGSGAQDFIFDANSTWHTVLGGSMIPAPSTYGNVTFTGSALALSSVILPAHGYYQVGPANVVDSTRLFKGLTGAGFPDVASIAAGATAEFNITVTGAAVGDVVSVGPPTLTAGLMHDGGRVSATNTVTVRIYNSNAISVDPAGATWKAVVFK